jgi:hypothetical protein
VSGYLRIGGTFVLGILIVLGSFQLAEKRNAGQENAALIATAPSRSYIAPVDADGDGIDDWEEDLTNRVIDAIQVPSSTPQNTEGVAYEAPESFTGKFAEAFFSDYITRKSTSGSGEISDKESFISGAIKAIEVNTASKLYTLQDITMMPDSDEALRDYGNAIAGIMARNAIDNENEAVILKRALDTSDPSLLQNLAPIREVYEKTLAETLVTPVPTSLATAHTALLSSYEAIHTDIEAMEQAFTDPLLALTRIKRYEDDATALYISLKTIGKTLVTRGITYAKDEPGALFYMLDI